MSDKTDDLLVNAALRFGNRHAAKIEALGADGRLVIWLHDGVNPACRLVRESKAKVLADNVQALADRFCLNGDADAGSVLEDVANHIRLLAPL